MPGILLAALLASYADFVLEWRRAHEAQVRAEDGWLSYAGLAWLKPGPNRAGSDPDSDILLPPSVPAHAGVFEFREGRVFFEGKRVATDHPGPPDIVRLGGLKLHVIVRGGRVGIRVRDNASAYRRGLRGLRWFPVDERFRVRARWVAYPRPRAITVRNVVGIDEQSTAPGYAEFSLHGQTLRLEPVVEGKRLFYVFRDRTSGKQTYPAARFLYSDPPRDGYVLLDFNLAHNPACAFTDYATCPLPQRGNILPVPIEAGELYPPDRLVPGAPR